jgi:hypothetical protein
VTEAEDEIANILLKKKIETDLFVYRNLQSGIWGFQLIFGHSSPSYTLIWHPIICNVVHRLQAFTSAPFRQSSQNKKLLFSDNFLPRKIINKKK